MEPIIAFLTDFGTRGHHYVALMKAVILQINPLVRFVDISHNITEFSVIEASYILKTTYKHFPKGTIFITVVDPGVGSSREILALKTKSNYIFIAPNNGIFPNVFDESEISECINIQNEDFFVKPVSPTFHGRDIMSPTAAHISKSQNFSLRALGSKFNFNSLIKFPVIYEIDLEIKVVKGTIQYIDSFGNGTTAIPMIGNKIKDTSLILENEISISVNNNKYDGLFSPHFSGVPKDSILLLVGSTGFLEVSINQGDAAKILDFKVGDIITIRL
ncbi:hypothetical protein LCGC14_0756220 [marine sediment metagenome]|uniref:S-adenosyl-l-methionine hydroxide adenosyltransferase n=1 Tax=marine sediment metagenome TaxID=412755 RepID=A0A0F9SMR2_9ZZZZ|nr:hypothetical protein [bacterium]